MTHIPETHFVAKHLVACPYYQLPAPDRGDDKVRPRSFAAATAEANVVTVTVRDFDGRERVYRATVVEVGV